MPRSADLGAGQASVQRPASASSKSDVFEPLLPRQSDRHTSWDSVRREIACVPGLAQCLLTVECSINRIITFMIAFLHFPKVFDTFPPYAAMR